MRLQTRKYFVERAIIALHFGENYASLPSPILEEAWRTRCTSFISERCYRFTIVRQMAPLPSGLSAAIECHSSSHLVLLYFQGIEWPTNKNVMCPSEITR